MNAKNNLSHYLVIFFLIFYFKSHGNVVFNWGIDSKMAYFVEIANRFKSKVEKESNGRIRINIKQFTVKDDIKNSTSFFQEKKFDIHQQVIDNLYADVPGLAATSLPYMFFNEKHIEDYFESDRANQHLKKFENDIILPVGFLLTGGFLFMYGPKKIESFMDLIGKNVITFGSELRYTEKYYKNLGILPVSRLNHVPSKSDEIGELDSLWDVSEAKNLPIRDFTFTNHRILSSVLSISKQKLNQLNKKDREYLVLELKRVALFERQFLEKSKAKLVKKLSGKLRFHTWDRQQWEDAKKMFAPQYKNESPAVQKEIEYIDSLIFEKKSTQK